jgi:hypothetical protein
MISHAPPPIDPIAYTSRPEWLVTLPPGKGAPSLVGTGVDVSGNVIAATQTGSAPTLVGGQPPVGASNTLAGATATAPVGAGVATGAVLAGAALVRGGLATGGMLVTGVVAGELGVVSAVFHFCVDAPPHAASGRSRSSPNGSTLMPRF